MNGHNTTQAIIWFAHKFADTQIAQNLKSASNKQKCYNSNFHFCLNIEILCIYTKYIFYPSFSTRLIWKSLIFPHYPDAPWNCCCLCSKACWLNSCCCFCRNCTTSGLLSRDSLFLFNTCSKRVGLAGRSPMDPVLCFETDAEPSTLSYHLR